MTDAVNYGSRAGSFLGGKPNWISIATLVPVEETRVTTPVRDLPGYNTYATLGIWTSVYVTDGSGIVQEYDSISSYRQAYFRQQNLNWLVRKVGERTNVTQVSVKIQPSSVNGVAINPRTSPFFTESGYCNKAGAYHFGSDYTGTGYTVYLVDMAVEHTHAWSAIGFSNFGTTAPAESNDDGYGLQAAIDGNLAAYPEDQNSVNQSDAGVNDPYYYTMAFDLNDTDGPAIAYWDCNTDSGTNTLVSFGDVLPGVATV